MPLVGVGQVEAFGLNIVMGPLQTGVADGGSVYEWRDVLDVLGYQSIEKVYIGVPETAEIKIFIDAFFSSRELFQASLKLDVLVFHRWGE